MEAVSVKVADKPVKIADEVYTKVKEYSEKTGIPIKRVLAEAVSDWLDTVGEARLEALSRVTIVGTPFLIHKGNVNIDIDEAQERVIKMLSTSQTMEATN